MMNIMEFDKLIIRKTQARDIARLGRIRASISWL
jgi:hypothetical protein